MRWPQHAVVPVVVAVNEEAVVAIAIGPGGIGERHSLVAVVHRPHPELHSHSSRGKVLEVCSQQHLHDMTDFQFLQPQALQQHVSSSSSSALQDQTGLDPCQQPWRTPQELSVIQRQPAPMLQVAVNSGPARPSQIPARPSFSQTLLDQPYHTMQQIL